MRRRVLITLVFITVFLLSMTDLSGENAATTLAANSDTSDTALLSDSSTPYVGTGSALTISFSGTFTNSTPWTKTSQTLSSDFTPGTSFLATNSSSVVWTAYILVSPPAGIKTLSYTVAFPGTEWRPTALINPVGVSMSYPSQWWYDADKVYVSSSAVATYGVWKLEFLGVNQLSDLKLGKSSGPFSSTATFNTNDEMLFRTTSTWITSSTTEYVLTDPTGSAWYSGTNTTSGATSHLLQSFAYRKDITVDRSRHLSTSLTNFPVLIDIYDADLHTKVQPNGEDIVFYAGGNIVPHEIELFDQNYSPTQAHLIAWVKVNLTGTVNTVISMYYGNPLIGPQQRPELVWTQSFAAVWHLKETAIAGGTSTVHYDSTSHNYDGQQNGNANDVGKIGTGQRFDGVNDQVVISSSKGLDPSGDVEISFWFKLDTSFTTTTQYTQALITKYSTGNDNMNIALVGTDYTYLLSPGSLVFKIENAGAQKYKYTTPRTWTAGVWYYVSCYLDADTPDNNKVFVNGADSTYGTSGALATASLSFSSDWGIGGGTIDQGGQPTAWLDGVIDEVRVSNTILASAWRSASYSNQFNPSNFYASVGSEQQRVSPELTMKKIADSTAMAGVWKVSAFYNDSGSSVNYRVGMYERVFTIQRASSLVVSAPTAAVGNGVVSLSIGDILYTEVDLTDSLIGGITGANVAMNWTVLGVSSPINLNDMGGGVYGVAVNTSDLETNIRWRINIMATAEYHISSSTYFYLDLYHETKLDYSDVSTTPVGFDSNATLTFYDTYDSSRISGATITFANGNPVTISSQANGVYHISVDTSPLSQGKYSYLVNATKPGFLYRMATANLAFTIRPHYTALSVSGNLVTPVGQNTVLAVQLIDVDTGTMVDIADITSLSFTSSYGSQIKYSYSVTLTTDTWAVAGTPVTLSAIMGSSDYFTPDPYNFVITIRKHNTALSVTGGLVNPYGNVTPLTIIITDIDTGTLLSSSVVQSFTFTSSYAPYSESDPIADLVVNLPTGSWSVGTHAVTLQVVMKASSNYNSPTNYGFSLTIRSLSTVLYNLPNDLVFPNGDDLVVDLQFNVSEPGPYYRDYIDGVLNAAFYVNNASSFVFPKTVVGLGNGVYRLTISASYFPEGTFTIFITVSPSNPNYARTSMILTFQYRPARSDLTANLYTVSTPYHHNVTVTLSYVDLDRAIGIVTGAISSPDGWVSYTHTGGGSYSVVIGVYSLNVGTHQINLTAQASGYATKSVIITVIVTKIHTDAQASVISLDMPVGNTKVIYIDLTDLDNSIPIPSVIPSNDWTGSIPISVVWTGTRYEVTIQTTGSDTLGLYTVTFTFSPGANYFDTSCQVEVDVRTHVTIFNLVSAVEPTPFNGIVNISLRYYDWDNKAGITDDTNIQALVWNQTNWISSTLVNTGGGYYTLQIDATQFGQGLQYFDIYFNWVGPVQQYENKSTTASVNIIGLGSQLALLSSSEPTAYLGIMNYTFLFSELSGLGITNTSYGGGHVHISVSFQGVSVDLSKVNIAEIDSVLEPGKYSISFNTTIFSKTGLIYMNVYINWSAGVAPYYTDRADVISVRVLPRDTLLAVIPPSPTAYGENATFTFSFDDITGGSDIPIDNSAALTVLLSLGDYSIYYNSTTNLFTISFDTSQFGAPLGQKSFTLGVTWAGSPFYANRTGRVLYISVTARQTTLDFQSPAPTSYLDNVSLAIEWNDVTTGTPTGISGAALLLYDVTGATYIPDTFYTVYWISGGQYEIAFNTTYYATPNIYNLRVYLSTPDFFIPDVSSTRSFNVRYRLTLLSAEPIGLSPYNSSLVYTLDFQDLDTLETIPSPGGEVTIVVLNASWTFSAVWNPAFQTYTLTIDTYNHPELTIGTIYSLHIQASYSAQSPFFASDDAYITFQLRTRRSSLVVDDSPDPTAYLENAQFRIYYSDADSSVGITANSIAIHKGVDLLAQGTDYTLTYQGNGYYLISVKTTSLGVLGFTTLNITAIWNPASPPYHDSASVNVNIYVTRREANVEITVPPSQTRFLDNITFSFVYRDLRSGLAIGTITSTNVAIWAGGILLTSGQYVLTKDGSTFTVSINSTQISSSLVSSYNVTVLVDWNDATAPYYIDDSSIVRVTTINRRMSYAVLPAEETAYGNLLNLSFSITDADSGKPVVLVPGNILFDGKTVALVEGIDFTINFSQAAAGIYVIRINTVAVGLPETYQFNLYVNWNAASQPYYSSLTPTNPIVMSGVISKIDTLLIHWGSDPETATWGGSSIGIVVNYTNSVFGNLTKGANVTWAWPEAGVAYGPTGESLGDGIYSADINPSLADAGTYILTFRATGLKAYKDAYVYITFVVVAAGSDMVPIDPTLPVVQIDRGNPLDITIRLDDGSSNPINNTLVISVVATIDKYDYVLSYNGTIGYYTVQLPANDGNATKKTPGFYTISILASLHNYEPAAYSFKIQILQTATAILLTGSTEAEMLRTYTENVNIYVQLVIPIQGNTSFYHANITWIVYGTLTSGEFIHLSDGNYTATLDTTVIGYGIWTIIFKATPWENESLYASSQRIITFTIQKIKTSSTPPPTRDYYWGWAGYLVFQYWDETFNRGIEGASVIIELPGWVGEIEYTTNGTYRVFFDTSLLQASTNYIPLTITFQKANYLSSSSIINIRVLEVPTEASILTPLINIDPEHSNQYIVPIGDVLNITVFYNDTDYSDFHVGGISGSNLTINEIYGPTRTLTGFDLVELGGGYYYFLFDTTDPWLFEASIGGPSVQVDPYMLTFRLSLGNYSVSIQKIAVRIIPIPTSIEVVSAVGSLLYGESGSLVVKYVDIWPGHPNGTLISGANFTINSEQTQTNLLIIGAPYEDPARPGYYIIEFTAASPLIGDDTAISQISLTLSTPSAEAQLVSASIRIAPTQISITLTMIATWGTPIIILIALLGGLYIRVLSVPKRLRQINGQIKALRKGKMPKPVADARSRQDIVAGLFNDTFTTTGITRTPDQMPEESIPVEVPELGELLIQLAILTNLNAQELDDFKADISKMKMSEQAAFVKEVIMQEAIRAARRQNKTVEQIIEDVQSQASKRVARAAEGAIPEEEPEVVEPEVERVILPTVKPPVKPKRREEFEEPKIARDEEEVSSGDRLTPFEIEELKKDLQAKGVPLHEIDTILQQVRELPRDLVDELIKSLDKKRTSSD